jgi:phosphoribosyl-ATP pyrophosphohydrolase/phosphoribosyl-AMP cyclohydrolase
MTEDLRPGIVQDRRTGQVLMLGYLNREALERTRETGMVHFYSRSRERIWKKGETSGNTLSVVAMAEDCDGDTLLFQVIPEGPTCHTGSVSCFGAGESSGTLGALWGTVISRRQLRPPGSYTVSLFEAGTEVVGRKLVEEAVETLLAAKDHAVGAPGGRLAEEASDLLYHLLVLLAERGVELEEVMAVLEARARGGAGGNSSAYPAGRDTMDPGTSTAEEIVANKDRGGKNQKKVATKDLKQKRQDKKAKKAGAARKSV